MSPAQLEQYLYDHIPISKEMAVSVVSIHADEVILSAPLAPNINHCETVFGGSASALAILAAWSLLYVRLDQEDIDARLVIQRNTMEYNSPILGEFTARSFMEQTEIWQKFTHTLERKGKARMTLISVLEYQGKIVGKLTGTFVALKIEDVAIRHKRTL